MMRKRYQKGSLRRVNGRWIAQWWEESHRRKRTLGLVSQMTKSRARLELDGILAPINSRQDVPSTKCTFGDFVKHVYLPFYRRKWKDSTAFTTEHRIKTHVTSEFSVRTLGSFTRDELQSFLDSKAQRGLSFSTVDHLRWDLKQILDMAVAEGYLRRNPAELLFTPRLAARSEKRWMQWKEVSLCFSLPDLRERLICMLALLAGMRPGEIFALAWEHVKGDHLQVVQRVYKRKLDTPKTNHSVRKVALSETLQETIEEWRSLSGGGDVSSWMFPSETGKTPLTPENCWRRYIEPKLRPAHLGWINFQVMRRTHSSLMRELEVDPKLVADQLGHSLDVSMNVYTESALERRKEALSLFEKALAEKGIEARPVR